MEALPRVVLLEQDGAGEADDPVLVGGDADDVDAGLARNTWPKGVDEPREWGYLVRMVRSVIAATRTSGKTPPSRINDPDRTRADILDVATAHFALKGLTGSRVDEIAEQTHTSKRMLYYYFGNKEGLYRAVLERCYSAIRSLEASIDLDTLSPIESLRRHVEVSFRFHSENPGFVRLVMVENIHQGEHIAHVPAIKTRAASVVEILSRLLDRGVNEGVFRDGIDPIDLHMTISALCFYNVSNRYTFSKIFDRDMADEANQRRRSELVADTVMRWVCLPS